MKNYKEMNADQLHSEFTRLNKKLILPNIIIAIISIIACVAQLFMPFFEMTVHLNGDVVALVVDEFYTEELQETASDDSLNSVLVHTLSADNIKSATADLDESFSLHIDAHELLSIALASEDTLEDEIIALLAELLDEINIKYEIEAALKAAMPTIVTVAVTETIKTYNENLTDEQITIIESCTESIQASVEKLAAVETVTEDVKEEVKTEIKTSVTEAMAEAECSEETIDTVLDEIDEYFDAFLDAATDDEGNFSYLTLLENIHLIIEKLKSGEITKEEIGEIVEEITGGEITGEEVGEIIDDITEGEITDEDIEGVIEDITGGDSESGENGESSVNGAAAIRYTLTADESGSSSDDSTSEAIETVQNISYYLSLLDDSEALIREILDGNGLESETLQTIRTASIGLLIFIAVIAALWAILAIMSLVHIFIHNKKVGMWYVKLFGGLAAAAFFLLPASFVIFSNSYAAILAAQLGTEASVLTTLGNALSFGGAEIIVLVCLLALWIISIFWCHPINKRIRACHKELKSYK